MAGQIFTTLFTRLHVNALVALRIACVAVVGLAGAGIPAAHASEKEYAEALQQFRSGRLAEAYGRFTVLANRGDADAARIAIFMHKFGPALYGRYWDVTQHEAKAWETLANNGKERQEPPVRTVLNTKPTAKAAAPAPARVRPATTPTALVPASASGAFAGSGAGSAERKEF